MPSLAAPRRLTDIEAVNLILKNAGEAPVNSIGSDARPAAQKARDMLAEESIRVQTDGWNFNTERELKLEPSPTTGEIALPDNLMAFTPIGASVYLNLQEDGDRLYNSKDSTHKFTKPVTVEAVLVKPFMRLPQAARWFIAVGAALRYSNAENPGGANLRLTLEDLSAAKVALEQYDRRLRKGGLREHNPHFRRLRGNR